MEKQKDYYIYILTNYTNSTFYIGVTSNLEKRIFEHRSRRTDSFTEKYKTSKLVYYEYTDNPTTAITREKQLKNWHRQWKINLIKTKNPKFIDLSKNQYQFPILVP